MTDPDPGPDDQHQTENHGYNFAPAPGNPTDGSYGPYTLDYDDDADRLTVTDADGTEWPFPDAGLSATHPEASDVDVTEDFCAAVVGHAYRVTGQLQTHPPRKKRECKVCGKTQVESPSTWRDTPNTWRDTDE